mmetsp:Transcript_31268/g.79868  ORF Transcript_31268/g.79868 Transcript_31268/m.79868 type:complete len:205 (+) Transcript_31268:178-792(+)
MERVAEPPPALALTTSSPPNWMRCVRASRSASLSVVPGTCESRGRIVMPAWPPMTVTSMSLGCFPWLAAKKVFARHTSSVVTPHSLFLLYTPSFLSTSAAIGTVELTGFEMIASTASGANLPHPSTSVLTIPAFVLNRSSRVMPGLRGTPAGITTTSAPLTAASSPLSCVGGQAPADGRWPVIFAPVGQCERSAATPGRTGATS